MTGTIAVVGSSSQSLVQATDSAQNDSVVSRDSGGSSSHTNLTMVKTITGSITAGIASKTTAYSATALDHTILCDATGGAFDVTLPAAAGCAGLILVIKKVDNSVNAVGINPNGSELIDGTSTTLSLATQWNSRVIQSNGTSWFVLADK